MARVKTTRTERITLMLAPADVEYLTKVANERGVNSISMVTHQVINEHRSSFFSERGNSSIQEAEVSATTDQAA